MKQPSIIALVIAAAVLAAGIAWWTLARERAARDYAQAIAICKTDPVAGASLISSLDAIHGESARPNAIKVRIGMCVLDGSIEQLRRANARIEALR